MRIFKILALAGLIAGLTTTTEAATKAMPVLQFEMAITLHPVELHQHYIALETKTFEQAHVAVTHCPVYVHVRDLRQEQRKNRFIKMFTDAEAATKSESGYDSLAIHFNIKPSGNYKIPLVR